MKRISAFLFTTMLCSAVVAAESPQFSVTTDAIGKDGYVKPEYAYCIGDEQTPSKPGKNIVPGLAWSNYPSNTKSFAVIAVDPDVPTDFSDAGKEGKTIKADMKRQDFYHWILYNIPANVASLPEDQRNKYGEGINDYTKFSADKKEHRGYDGPCPPWNDERIHNYHFKVFALDIELINGCSVNPLCDMKVFNGEELMKAMQGHIINETEIVGKYSLNPAIKK